MSPIYTDGYMVKRLIVVSLDDVHLVGKTRPLNYTKFEAIESYNYSSKEELLVILEDLRIQNK